MHKNTYVAVSAIHGKGLFANTAIAGGEVIGWLNGKPNPFISYDKSL